MNTIEIDLRQLPAIGQETRTMQLEAGRNEILGAPGTVEKLKRPAPHDKRFRFVVRTGDLSTMRTEI